MTGGLVVATCSRDRRRTKTLRAVILSAGQGRRLLPLTEALPKCLLRVAGRSVLEWQVRALAANGITDITVVTGFQAEAVEEEVHHRLGDFGAVVRTRFNPFFAVADNAGSCFLARDLLHGDALLLNGDTLFEPALLRPVLAAPRAPLTVTIDRAKQSYDADDMKVSLDGDRLRAIGKTLPPERTDGESIGLLVFRDEGGAMFEAGLEAVLRQPEGLRRWYLSVVDGLAAAMPVRTVSIDGFAWGEIDFPDDIARAEAMAQSWREREAARPRLAAASGD
jgi:choline kinase